MVKKGRADSNSDSSVEVLGVSGPDVPEKASVGGAVKVEAPAVDGTSEKSQLGHDEIEVDALKAKATPVEARYVGIFELVCANAE
ncbi:hypothetical protein PHMEG_0003216 [Phytophthora megakarya]|uniref:Uncharacterized protein n=1 Tax=Phytophthora megakarya TaxID=4795 RepID=A0A225WYK0_9STRA|nr:hypothetical protein PHMEG_0003216 [Phytophthora megakarya]